MGVVIHCDCGYTITGETDLALIERAREHYEAEHPDLAEEVSDEELLAMIEDE